MLNKPPNPISAITICPTITPFTALITERRIPVIISGIADGMTIQNIICHREQPKILPISTNESLTCVTPAWVSIITTQIENSITVAITVASPKNQEKVNEKKSTFWHIEIYKKSRKSTA